MHRGRVWILTPASTAAAGPQTNGPFHPVEAGETVRCWERQGSVDVRRKKFCGSGPWFCDFPG